TRKKPGPTVRRLIDPGHSRAKLLAAPAGHYQQPPGPSVPSTGPARHEPLPGGPRVALEVHPRLVGHTLEILRCGLRVQVGYHHPARLFAGPPASARLRPPRLIPGTPGFLPCPLVLHAHIAPAACYFPVRYVHVPRRVHAVRHYVVDGPVVRSIRIARLLDLNATHVAPRISRNNLLHLPTKPFRPWTMRALAACFTLT